MAGLLLAAAIRLPFTVTGSWSLKTDKVGSFDELRQLLRAGEP